MGQYYLGYTKNEILKKEIIWKNPSGLKLMEHSYFGNNFVNGMCRELFGSPKRVAWVGDYADDFYNYIVKGGDGYFNGDNSDKILDIHKLVWNENAIRTDLPTPFDNLDKYGLSDNIYYLVNHSKQEYINLHKYLENQKKQYDNEWDLFIHPLPLLTAIGNGMGGGDYHEQMNYEMVGYWFYDLISVASNAFIAPDEYKDVTNTTDYQFVEFNN